MRVGFILATLLIILATEGVNAESEVERRKLEGHGGDSTPFPSPSAAGDVASAPALNPVEVMIETSDDTDGIELSKREERKQNQALAAEGAGSATDMETRGDRSKEKTESRMKNPEKIVSGFKNEASKNKKPPSGGQKEAKWIREQSKKEATQREKKAMNKRKPRNKNKKNGKENGNGQQGRDKKQVQEPVQEPRAADPTYKPTYMPTYFPTTFMPTMSPTFIGDWNQSFKGPKPKYVYVEDKWSNGGGYLVPYIPPKTAPPTTFMPTTYPPTIDPDATPSPNTNPTYMPTYFPTTYTPTFSPIPWGGGSWGGGSSWASPPKPAPAWQGSWQRPSWGSSRWANPPKPSPTWQNGWQSSWGGSGSWSSPPRNPPGWRGSSGTSRYWHDSREASMKKPRPVHSRSSSKSDKKKPLPPSRYSPTSSYWRAPAWAPTWNAPTWRAPTWNAHTWNAPAWRAPTWYGSGKNHYSGAMMMRSDSASPGTTDAKTGNSEASGNMEVKHSTMQSPTWDAPATSSWHAPDPDWYGPDWHWPDTASHDTGSKGGKSKAGKSTGKSGKGRRRRLSSRRR